MGDFREVEGDIFEYFKTGNYDVIAQGNNCFNIQGGGIAPKFVKAFETDKFKMENKRYEGEINKLGTIDYKVGMIIGGKFTWRIINKLFLGCHVVVNCYTQFGFGRNHADGTDIPLDYNALAMCLKKINHIFKGKRILLPAIGAGLGGGDLEVIKLMMQEYLRDCDTTLVIYKAKQDE